MFNSSGEAVLLSDTLKCPTLSHVVQIRSQDVSSFVVSTASGSPDRVETGWKYVIGHKQEFGKILGGTEADTLRLVDTMLANVAENFATRDAAADVVEQFSGTGGAGPGKLPAYAQVRSSARKRRERMFIVVNTVVIKSSCEHAHISGCRCVACHLHDIHDALIVFSMECGLLIVVSAVLRARWLKSLLVAGCVVKHQRARVVERRHGAWRMRLAARQCLIITASTHVSYYPAMLFMRHHALISCIQLPTMLSVLVQFAMGSSPLRTTHAWRSVT